MQRSAPSNTPDHSLRLAISGVVLAVFGAKLLLIRFYGSPVPNYDQWQSEARLLFIPFFDHYLKAKYFWVPHNEHRVVLTRLLNFFLMLSNGQWDTRLEMTVNAALHAGFAGALVAFASKRVRAWGLAAVSAAAVAVFGLPCAWENTLGGFQSQFYFLCWMALGQIWLCTTARALDRRWWGGFAMGVLGLGTMASGFISSGLVLGVLCLGLLRKRKLSRDEGVAALLLLSVCAAGLLLMHRTEGSSRYDAQSLRLWLASAAYAFGWPDRWTFAGCLVFQVPLVALGVSLTRGRRSDAWEWALLALGCWAWAQMGSLTLTRSSVIASSSKYVDIFAVSLFANALSLVILSGRSRLAGAAVALWLAFLGVGLSLAAKQAIADLGSYRASQLATAEHIRAYVVSGDVTVLSSAPDKERPYPDAGYLAHMLSHRGMRPLLPRELQAPQSWKGYGPDSVVANALQEWALWILALGILLAAIGLGRIWTCGGPELVSSPCTT
jgi:hypothetical protein